MSSLIGWSFYLQRESWEGKDPYYPRELWDEFDPMLLSEGAFGAAMIFRSVYDVSIISIIYTMVIHYLELTEFDGFIAF